MHFDTEADMPPGMRRLYQEQQSKKADKPAPAAVPAEKVSKYHNERDERGGIYFDSKKEARRFDYLLTLWLDEKIRDLKLQPSFTLREAYTTPEGLHVRSIVYKADFSYELPAGIDSNGNTLWELVVEDAKSRPTKTRVYELKKKLFREKYGMEIREV